MTAWTVPFFAHFYPWTKALHVIAVIAWMAAILYLPRLYVYHAGAAPGSELSERLKVMEHKLYKQILMPAMIVTFAFGIILALTPGTIDWREGWFPVKLVAVLLLAGFHGALGRWRRDFLNDRNRRPARFYRIANEVPTLLMIVAVIMVIVQPF